ncbi:MAG: diphthine--ammonia ligase [Candidatus Bathyarchaeota archaeon]|nr:diphthine--ammonia ligase [Candidatus Bathyarchaeota archaeon]
MSKKKNMNVAIAWSGGKDSCLACYKAIKAGHNVFSLLIMMADENKSYFHLINSSLLDSQSNALGFPIIKQTTTLDMYETNFKKVLFELKNKGVEGLVSGDVFDVALHEKGWLDRICREVGLIPVRPLWHLDTNQILTEFINEGFKAIVVRVKSAVLGLEWLGREIDQKFFKDLLELGTIDPCGEYGEFHSFVTDGPIFRSKIKITESEKTTINGYGWLKINQFKINSKG